MNKYAALSQICSSAADRGQTAAATQAFEGLSVEAQNTATPAMLVMHVRICFALM